MVAILDAVSLRGSSLAILRALHCSAIARLMSAVMAEAHTTEAWAADSGVGRSPGVHRNCLPAFVVIVWKSNRGLRAELAFQRSIHRDHLPSSVIMKLFAGVGYAGYPDTDRPAKIPFCPIPGFVSLSPQITRRANINASGSAASSDMGGSKGSDNFWRLGSRTREVPRLVVGSTAVRIRPIVEPGGDHSIAIDEDWFVEFSTNLIRPQLYGVRRTT